MRGKGEGHARKEGGRRGGKHLEGVAILLLKVASCHRNLSGYPVVMLPQGVVGIKPVKVFCPSDILRHVCIRHFNKCACCMLLVEPVEKLNSKFF